MSAQIQLSENVTEAERHSDPAAGSNLTNGRDDARETFALLLRAPDSDEGHCSPVLLVNVVVN